MWYGYKLSLTMRTNLESDSILTATVGIASPVLGVITSFQEQIEWTLRVASLIVGLMVGAMSLIAMVKKMRGSDTGLAGDALSLRRRNRIQTSRMKLSSVITYRLVQLRAQSNELVIAHSFAAPFIVRLGIDCF